MHVLEILKQQPKGTFSVHKNIHFSTVPHYFTKKSIELRPVYNNYNYDVLIIVYREVHKTTITITTQRNNFFWNHSPADFRLMNNKNPDSQSEST